MPQRFRGAGRETLKVNLICSFGVEQTVPAGGQQGEETFRALGGGVNGQRAAYATSFLSLASVSGEPK